jgi:hypothetical protein
MPNGNCVVRCKARLSGSMLATMIRTSQSFPSALVRADIRCPGLAGPAGLPIAKGNLGRLSLRQPAPREKSTARNGCATKRRFAARREKPLLCAVMSLFQSDGAEDGFAAEGSAKTVQGEGEADEESKPGTGGIPVREIKRLGEYSQDSAEELGEGEAQQAEAVHGDQNDQDFQCDRGHLKEQVLAGEMTTRACGKMFKWEVRRAGRGR